MSDDTPIVGKKARQHAFGSNSPLGDDHWQGSSDYLDPLHVFHDTADPNNSFAAALGKPGAAHGGIDSFSPPTQDTAAQAALSDQMNRENRIRSASTILSGGAGLLDNPNTYSASRSLLGS